MTLADQLRHGHAELDWLDVPREHDGMTLTLEGRIRLALTGSTLPSRARLKQVDRLGRTVPTRYA
jgi:hypothetical protein